MNSWTVQGVSRTHKRRPNLSFCPTHNSPRLRTLRCCLQSNKIIYACVELHPPIAGGLPLNFGQKQNRGRVGNVGDFQPTSRSISETVRDRTTIRPTIDH